MSAAALAGRKGTTSVLGTGRHDKTRHGGVPATLNDVTHADISRLPGVVMNRRRSYLRNSRARDQQ